MSNPYGRSGAPMIQPTKDDLRQWLIQARLDADDERQRRKSVEFKLAIATEKLGKLVLAGKNSDFKETS